jgi:hypothetical protein
MSKSSALHILWLFELIDAWGFWAIEPAGQLLESDRLGASNPITRLQCARRELL